MVVSAAILNRAPAAFLPLEPSLNSNRLNRKSRTKNAEKPPFQAVFLPKVVGVRGLEPRASCSQSRRATNCATPRYEVVKLSGRFLPKQARYQLRYTRLWNCFICGLSCGLGRFLTNGSDELVPASGSVPAGCGVVVLSSWMGGVFSQSKRATPGYEVVRRSGRILLNCAILSHMELENGMGIQTSSAVLDWSMCWYMQDWIFMSIPLPSPEKYPLAKPEDIFLQFEPYSCRRRSTTE